MTSPSTAGPTRAHRARRPPPTLVVAAVVAVVVALVGFLLPPVGRQLGLSLSRQPGTWTALYFTGAGSSSGAAGCSVAAGEVTTRFTLVSHEGAAREVDYRVVVRPAADVGAADVVREGTRAVASGKTATVSTSVPTASPGDQQVVVTLPDTGAQITARCQRGES
ncbi:hypothetical protein SAMN04488570_3326 [Nocardioides scoriae]|uniref:DUF4307 domain-containing protein n=1 Tax=Nocardioides scoriae TaxID=642780 RepID=A0A1H1X0N9_9ACTN|nr:hypothetical protein [Nocardioides scoriae]SDT02630.1 hypothetical protein SAMN04488570_3326 [Nocardioides scoriae]